MYICGYSGHSYVVIETLLDLGYQVKGYFDSMKNKKNPYSIDYLGFEQTISLRKIVGNDLVFPTVGNNIIRFKISELLIRDNLLSIPIIDKSAIVSKTATIGNGTFVSKNASINAFCSIGIGAIINTGAVVEHECGIGDFGHIAPNATLAGNVKIGKYSFIGAGSIVRQGVCIGENVIIGAGSVVLNDIPDNQIWVGNPSRFLRYAK